MASKSLEKSLFVTFFDRKVEYRSLSNFWECDVVIEGPPHRHYKSGEHAFHGEKYTRLGLQSTDDKRRQQLLEYGRQFQHPSPFTTGAEVKKRGGKRGLMLTLEEVNDWSVLSIEVQREICRFKMWHYAEVRDDLLRSQGKILIHPAMRCGEDKLKTRMWEGRGVVENGVVKVLGGNMLGLLWMEAREMVASV
jgi:predicted NAD-dependent protein-ADP-ribosyltransferase YbiA (DUF1768 family)